MKSTWILRNKYINNKYCLTQFKLTLVLNNSQHVSAFESHFHAEYKGVYINTVS